MLDYREAQSTGAQQWNELLKQGRLAGAAGGDEGEQRGHMLSTHVM
jgi:hypothetical protein